MQQNRRTVLISVVGVAAAIAVMAFVGTRMLGRISGISLQERPTATYSQGGEFILEADYVNFSSIAVVGGWSLTIVQGSEFDITVSGNEKAADEIEVFQRGSELVLGLQSGIRTATGNLQAVVVMPELVSLEIDGETTATIEGFDGGELSLVIDGAASIRATDSTFTLLNIDVDGAATLDFWESSVVNVALEMDGASRLSVTMDGGELGGVLRGVGEVRYRGEVSNQDVDVEGIGRVKQEM